ncbi:hypothetical protein [Streptomyces europaeiscabiei]|uniref:hypothetical protein n=1 Tax=Streptomyces europaeiscabiei TaxID=146819 RepID=UPI0030B9A336
MTTTPQSTAAPAASETSAVALQLSELVLKTGRYDDMAAFYTHVLGQGPFCERTPDPDAPPRPAGMPERAVDVRLGFFRVHDSPHGSQVLALFGIDSLIGTERSGPGLHHFQFGVATSAGIAKKYGCSLTNLLGIAGPDRFITGLARRLDTAAENGSWERGLAGGADECGDTVTLSGGPSWSSAR